MAEPASLGRPFRAANDNDRRRSPQLRGHRLRSIASQSTKNEGELASESVHLAKCWSVDAEGSHLLNVAGTGLGDPYTDWIPWRFCSSTILALVANYKRVSCPRGSSGSSLYGAKILRPGWDIVIDAVARKTKSTASEDHMMEIEGMLPV